MSGIKSATVALSNTAWEETGKRASDFIEALYRLARDRNADGPQGGVARQALAELRAGLAFSPSGRLRMARHVVPFLPPDPRPIDRWFYVVGALFAATPERRGGRRNVSLGAVFRELHEQKDGSESIEARFLALVNSRADNLPTYLRHAVSLFDSNEIELDWRLLLADLFGWGDPDRKVQDRWLRHFYRAPVGQADSDLDETSTDPFEGDDHEED